MVLASRLGLPGTPRLSNTGFTDALRDRVVASQGIVTPRSRETAAREEPPAPEPVSAAPAQARWIPLAVRIPHDTARSAGGGAHPLMLHIEQLASTEADPRTLTEKTTFLVPR